MDNDIVVTTLGDGGKVIDQAVLPRSSLMACPHLILELTHYRDDGSCRCDDPTDKDMVEWGYVWTDKGWQ